MYCTAETEDHMEHMKWKTRNGVSPQKLAKVYICCRPEDFADCFPAVADDILKLQNCALWYTDPSATVTSWDTHLDNLKQMNLIVLLVTEKFLTEPNHALDREFIFATQNHIPVLPLLQAPGLEKLFNEKCGHLQTLCRHTTDNTALLYDQKLEKQLKSALLDEGLTAQVRAAFDAYIFMSYRKKDRQYAQKLMELIHSDDSCRDVAIWYDEFLTPGEDFDDEIKRALEKGSVFALTVTPSLLEDGNYVMEQEYPNALALDKPIVAVEMQPTDGVALSDKFKGLDCCVDANNKASLQTAFRTALSSVPLKSKNDARHQFLMGLAYLNGIDVEIDYSYAQKLLLNASNAGIIEATDQLVYMYSSGKGVARDLSMATYWQKKLVEQCRHLFAQKTVHSTDSYTTLTAQLRRRATGIRLMVELLAMGELSYDCEDYNTCIPLFYEVFSVGKELGENSAEICQMMSAALTYLGHLYGFLDDHDQAVSHYEKSSTFLRKALQLKGIRIQNGEIQTDGQPLDAMELILLSDLCVNCCSVGDLWLQRANDEKSMPHVRTAEKHFMELYRYLLQPQLKNAYGGYPAQLATCYQRLGDIKRLYGQIEDACRLHSKAVSINKERMETAKINHDTEAYDDYALSCYFMGIALPGILGLEYLETARDIWGKLEKLLPEFSVYKERGEEVNQLITDLRIKLYSRKSYSPWLFNCYTPEAQSVLRGFLATGKHSLFLHCDGTVTARGLNSHRQCQTSAWKYEKLMAISAGDVTSWGLKENGTVIFQAGEDGSGLIHTYTEKHKNEPQFLSIESPNAEDMKSHIRSWSCVTDMDARGMGAALLADGQIVSTCHGPNKKWGLADGNHVGLACEDTRVAGITDQLAIVADHARFGLGIAPIDPPIKIMQKWTDITQIDMGKYCIVGLKKDGTVCVVDCSTVWRSALNPFHTQQSLPDPIDTAPLFFTDHWRTIVSVAAGNKHIVGLRSDGFVVACGNNDKGQCNVHDWCDIIAIAAQGDNTVGLRMDGSVVACGDNQYGQCDVAGIELFGLEHQLANRVEDILRIKNNLKKQVAAQPKAVSESKKTTLEPQVPTQKAPDVHKPAEQKKLSEDQKKQNEFLNALNDANNGNAKDMYQVARYYYEGRGTDIDIKKAEMWALRALDSDVLNVSSLLCDIYCHEKLPRPEQAVYWAKRAIEVGSIYAYRQLSTLYQSGYGVRKSRLRAWYYQRRYRLEFERLFKKPKKRR